ncbi:hypothetical protein EHJ07_16070 [Cronobacter muytjensii]|uniref:Uncharacterized protein n=1 Tax=Cronobacter muytjensii TaxID=413501 RepID=A0ABQ6TVK3_9ENTR|nr:hypothetical protein FZI19_18685 [Cronobacter muytjensii]NCH57074.1 hypothetical protein [Cronobacter muytjensii]NCI17992.1 hypothetical protein [Cronobacter muytjensii]
MPIEKTRAMAPSIYKEYDCQFTSESQEINLTLKLKNMIISMQTGTAQILCYRLLALVILL